MSFSSFITEVNGEVANKHSSTLTHLKRITVRQLAELSARRTLFMQDTATFTLLTAAPYGGQWADSSVAEFPKDVLEIDGAYYQVGGTGWEEIDGPVPLRDIRLYVQPVVAAQQPLARYPHLWSWWEGKFWTNTLSDDTAIKIDFWRDGTRCSTTGVKIQEDSTNETNPWLDGRGKPVLRCGVLADYYTMATSRDEAQASVEVGKRNTYLQTLFDELAMKQSVAIQAPMVMGGEAIWQ